MNKFKIPDPKIKINGKKEIIERATKFSFSGIILVISINL